MKAVSEAVKGGAHGLGSALSKGVAMITAQRQRSGSGPLLVPSIDPAYHEEVQRITRILHETHMGFINQFCKVADKDSHYVCNLIVNVVITHHHYVMTSRGSPKAKEALQGIEVAIEGPATRFLAVASGVLYICKPATAADSLFDTYVAAPADGFHELNPELYFSRVLHTSPKYDESIAFKQYFEKTPWQKALALEPNLSLDPALQPSIEKLWADYKQSHELGLEELRGVEPVLT